MRNPFRGEPAAFRFLLLTLVAFAAIGVAAILGGPRAAVPLWAAVSVAAVVLYARPRRAARSLRTAPAHVGPAGERRLLVLAQEPLPEESVEELRRRGDRVLVISSPTPTPLRRWVSDVDPARAAADARVNAVIEELRAADVDAAGAVGDEDPLRAIEDALRTFGGDEIVVATGRGPDGDRVVRRIRERFALPVTQLPA